jgi:4-amino-4-deoxy-L-arabinose transferase-like glycosyltransferase
MTRLTRHHALAFMVLALLVAAALRLPHLTAVPPGVHYDEAAYGLNAGDIGLRGDRPVFIPAFTGREPLYLYLAGGLARALGNTLFALRLTSAFIGLLTIAATYWLGREMLADRRIALLAAALLAVSFWHLLFSRLGFRVISQPLLQALAVAALFRGLRGGRWLWLWAAGLLIGLSAYTYLAARLFPVLLAAALLLPLLLDPDTRRLRLRQLLFVALVALLTALPLLAYFYFNPDAFWVRIGQVAPSAESLTLTDSLLRSFAMFFLRGDPYLRFNLPGLPLFDFVTGGLLLVGWLFCLLRYRRFPYDWQRAAVSLLLLAPLVMILPTALAVSEIVPSNLRALGLIPFIFFLPPIGLIALLRDVERRAGRPPLTRAVSVTVLFILLVGGVITQHRYFRQWATQPDLLLINDGDLTAAAAWLDETLAAFPPGEQPAVYVASVHYRHPTLAFLSANYDRLKWLPGSHALVFPAAGPALYLYPANSPAPEWALPWLEAEGPPEIITADNGVELFRVYRLSEPPALPAATEPAPRTAANFGGLIALDAIITEPAAAGETLPLTLRWTVTAAAPAGGAYSTFAHLEDMNGHRWSQIDQDGYPAEQWQPGEVILERIDLPVPPGMPPGEGGLYRLRLGRFDPATGDRLPRVDAGGAFAGDSLLSDDVAILPGPPPDPLPEPPFIVGEPAADGLRLLGYEPLARAAETGEPLRLAFWWSADAPLPFLQLRLSLVDASGAVRELGRGQPAYNTYPFHQWQTPAFVIDRQLFRVPDDLPGGDYAYRLELLDAAAQPVYSADLGPLAVTRTERLFELPPFATPVGATFGDQIALAGYTLETEFSGKNSSTPIPLELVWQAQAQPTADYTVFVHVLNADGTCCVWQSDAMPRGGAYPTSRWQPGEVVVDTYEIALPADLPPGEYPLEVGLYIAETGQRLGVVNEGVVGDALRLESFTAP